MNTVHILLADPQYLTRAGFLQLFGGTPSVRVVGEALDAAELREAVEQLKPELVVMDYDKQEHFGLEDMAALRRDFPATRILLVTDDSQKGNIFRALESGVTSILTKHCSRDEIISAVHATAKGEKFFCNKVLDILLEKHLGTAPKAEEEEGDCAPSVLSLREQEIVMLVAQGMPSRDIADRLCLSPHTVHTHRKNIMKKLGIGSATELVMYAVKMGMVKAGG